MFETEVIKASEHDYIAMINELQINSQYAAALMGNRVHLHMVRRISDENIDWTKMFRFY